MRYIYFPALLLALLTGLSMGATVNAQAPQPSLVKDISTKSVSISYGSLVEANGTLFFIGKDETNGIEVWKSDGTAEGTAEGTALVKDITPGPSIFQNKTPESLTPMADTLFFVADDDAHGRELWKSDGTEEGTVLVKDIYPNTDLNSSQSIAGPSDLLEIDGTLFFVADDGTVYVNKGETKK